MKSWPLAGCVTSVIMHEENRERQRSRHPDSQQGWRRARSHPAQELLRLQPRGSLEIHSQFTGDKERQSCAHWLKLLWHYHCKQCRESPTKQEWVTARWAIQKIPSCREAPLQQQKTPQYIDSHRGEFRSMWLVSKYKHLKYDIVKPSMACSLVTHGWRSY